MDKDHLTVIQLQGKVLPSEALPGAQCETYCRGFAAKCGITIIPWNCWTKQELICEMKKKISSFSKDSGKVAFFHFDARFGLQKQEHNLGLNVVESLGSVG